MDTEIEPISKVLTNGEYTINSTTGMLTLTASSSYSYQLVLKNSNGDVVCSSN